MSAPRPRFVLRRARLALSAVVPLLLPGCGGSGARAPDGSQVTAAQAEWCQALAKLNGAPDTWEHLSACKDVYPTASAAYLHGMTKCMVTRREAAGDKAPDQSQIIQDCNDEVTVTMTADEAETREVIDARCKRAERCEKVAVAECKAAVDKLQASQRALFTTTYNAGARHSIAECLSSKSCSDNEEEARDACYKPAADKLLWFPN
jgi:hypothetical protein